MAMLDTWQASEMHAAWSTLNGSGEKWTATSQKANSRMLSEHDC